MYDTFAFQELDFVSGSATFHSEDNEDQARSDLSDASTSFNHRQGPDSASMHGEDSGGLCTIFIPSPDPC